jgi:anti-sigma factor RsiW
VAFITTFLDGALDPRDRDRLDQHFEESPDCTEHLRQIETTIVASRRSAAVQPMDSAARENVVNLYRRWLRDGHRHP